MTAQFRGHRIGRLPAYEAFTATILAYGLVWGVATIIGDRQRWSGPAFGFARELAGGPVSWGASLTVFCATGVLGVVAGSRTIVQAGLVAAFLWSAAFAISLGAAAADNPQAALTGAITWGFHALLFLAAARRVRWG